MAERPHASALVLRLDLHRADEAVADEIGRALVPVFVFDAAGHGLLAANAAALRLYGYEEEDFLRLSVFDLCPPEETARLRRCLAAYPLVKGLRDGGLWRQRARDGRVFTASTLGLAIEFQGRAAVLVIVSDLTQTLRPADSRQAVAGPMFPFAEVMEEACWIRSLEDDRLLYANAAHERVFGLPREAVYADPAAIERLVLAEDLPAYLAYKAARRLGPARGEYRIRRPDGEVRWIASRSYRFEDAAGACLAAGFSEDVTARRAEERALLEACERQREALAHEVHHRIKNSLQGVHGLLQQAAARQPALAPALGEVTARLQSLATAHGLLARAARGRVGVCELLDGVAQAAACLPQARLQVDIPAERRSCPAIAEQDAVAVALALEEILTNAVKHGEAGAAVRIGFAFDAAAGTAEIRVVNAGRLPEGRCADAPALACSSSPPCFRRRARASS